MGMNGLLKVALVLLSVSSARAEPATELSGEVEEQCISKCPFQNRTDDGHYDLACGNECSIGQCNLGCRLWSKALVAPCKAVCNTTAEVLTPKELFCVIGCNEALNNYFQILKERIGIPPAPALVADSLTSTSLSLEWEGSRYSNLTYLVQWQYEELTGAWQYFRNKTWGHQSTIKVDNLHPYTKYRFRVAVLLSERHSDSIVSAPSVVISTLSAGRPSSAPIELRVTVVDSHRISLTWEPGPFPNGPILSYVLRISDTNVTNGFISVEDLSASDNLSYMFQNLLPSTVYNVSVAMQNVEGEGPSATVLEKTPASPAAVANQQPILILSSEHSVIQQNADDILGGHVILYNNKSSIQGVGIDVYRNLLFISESSGSIYKAPLDQNGPTITILSSPSISYHPLKVSVDWLNRHLYILGEVNRTSNNIGWQIVRCDYDGKSQTIAFAGFHSKPVHIEVDPYNGFLFWVLQGEISGGLYRLDLADISNGVKHEVLPDQIFKEPSLGVFTVDHTNFRVLVLYSKNNTVLSVSLDGREVVNLRENIQRPMFETGKSLSFVNGLFYWTNDRQFFSEEYHEGQDTYFHTAYPFDDDKNLKSILIALRSCQPIPIAVNPPIGLQSIMGTNHAKITWQRPHLLGHQGIGAWQQWHYDLQITDMKNESNIIRFLNNGTTSYIAKNLTENTMYIIKAAAVTSSGTGPWSSEFTAKTLSSPENGVFSSMLWSAHDGLLKSDLTGDNIQTLIHKSHLGNAYITDISWYKDQLYLVTNISRVIWYNMTTKEKGWIRDMENVGSIAVDWIGKKLYWSSPKQQLITRGNLRGGNREPVPIVTVGKELKIDSVKGFIYWNTGHAIECARLNGEGKITYYPAQLFRKQVMGLTVDLGGKLLYWIVHGYEGSKLYKAPTADTIMPNVEVTGTLISSLSNAATLGPLCYFSDRLIWLQDDSHAVISDVSGHNKANLNSITKANVNMIAVVDPNLQNSTNNQESINVIPEPVNNQSIKIVGSWDSFNITWDSIIQVNYGKIFYEVKTEYNAKMHSDSVTTEPYITYSGGDVPPYSLVELSIKPYTYWGSAPVVRARLRSPQAPPTQPTRPRVFILHDNNPFRQENEIRAEFRWDSPLHTNGIIKGYRVYCWYREDETDNTVCDGDVVEPHKPKFVARNILRNVTFFFQVRAFTDAGNGHSTRTIASLTDVESPIPRLVIAFHDSIKVVDLDRGDGYTNTITTNAGKPKDFAANFREDVIYWMNDIQEIFESPLHRTGHTKLMSINGTGVSITVDWITRMLYWSQLENLPEKYGCTVYQLDLNIYKSERILKIKRILQRDIHVKSLQISPITKSLYWIEMNHHGLGTLMTSHLNGSNIRSFFHQYRHFDNTNKDYKSQCNCPENPSVGKSFSLDLTNVKNFKLYWIDAWSKHITVADLNGCMCKVIVNATQYNDNALPAHFITIDNKYIYWSNSSQRHLYSVSKDTTNDLKIQQVNVTTGRKILGIGNRVQPYIPKICLSPKQSFNNKSLQVSLINRTYDSLTLQMPEPRKHPTCENYDMATPYYVIYYQPYTDGVENYCIKTICKTKKTFDKVLHLDGLKPFSTYMFTVKINNYYGELREIEPVLGSTVLFKTSAGAPLPVQNVKVYVLTPNRATIEWATLPNKYDNITTNDDLWYEIHWKNERVEEHIRIAKTKPPTPQNISYAYLSKLKAFQNYSVWVRSKNSDDHTDSEMVHIETYPEPNDIKATFIGPYIIHVSWLPYNNDIMSNFYMEYAESNENNWRRVEDEGSQKPDGTINYVIHNLLPDRKYSFRLEILFVNTRTPYVWPINSAYTFETLGDRPSPPGKPKIQRFSNTVYQLEWKPSDHNGGQIIQYRLYGKMCIPKKETESMETASALSRQVRETNYTQIQPQFNVKDNIESMLYDGNTDIVKDGWNILHNGTENRWIVTGLKPNEIYIFRVQAENSYGWSGFSEPSDEFDYSESIVSTAMIDNIATFIIIVVILLLIIVIIIGCLLRYYLSRKNIKKTVGQPSPFHGTLRGPDVELATLRELPRLRGGGGMFQHSTNILYNNGLCNPPSDAEISLLPHIRRDRITLTKFLGSGAFGEVFEGKAKDLDTDGSETRVAVKTLRKGATDQEKTEFLQEAQLMSNFKHEHILSMLGVCLDNDPHFIIMELMEGGDLLSYLRTRRPMLYTNDSLRLYDLLSMCMDVTRGCRYLEEMHFVHRDLACRNCLVSQQANGRIVKIGDFGLARDIYKNDYYRKEGEGLLPVRWMAVECLTDGVFSRASDVWAWAVLCWEVTALGRQPYSALTNRAVMRYVRGGGTLPKPANCPLVLFNLLQKCWSYNLDQRPTFKYCLEVLDELIKSTDENIPLIPSIDEEPQYITVVPDATGINNRVYFVDENQNNECSGLNHISENNPEVIQYIPQNTATVNPPKYLELLYDSDSIVAHSDGYEVPRSSIRSVKSRSVIPEESQGEVDCDRDVAAAMPSTSSDIVTLKVKVLDSNINGNQFNRHLCDNEQDANSLIKLIPHRNSFNELARQNSTASRVSDDEKLSQNTEANKLLNGNGFVRSLKYANCDASNKTPC